MYVSIDVTKPDGKGASDFFKALPKLLESAKTWDLVEHGSLSATIKSTATITVLPAPPKYRLRGEFAGSVIAEVLDAEDWTREQKVRALVYLCFIALGPSMRGAKLKG